MRVFKIFLLFLIALLFVKGMLATTEPCGDSCSNTFLAYSNDLYAFSLTMGVSGNTSSTYILTSPIYSFYNHSNLFVFDKKNVLMIDSGGIVTVKKTFSSEPTQVQVVAYPYIFVTFTTSIYMYSIETFDDVPMYVYVDTSTIPNIYSIAYDKMNDDLYFGGSFAIYRNGVESLYDIDNTDRCIASTSDDLIGKDKTATCARNIKYMVAAGGKLYFAGFGSIITTVNSMTARFACASSGADTGDNGPATSATCGTITSLFASPDESAILFTTSNGNLRSVNRATGIITTVSSSWPTSFTGIVGATQAYTFIYNNFVKSFNPQTNQFTTVLGADPKLLIGDGYSSVNAVGIQPNGLSMNKNGMIYVAETSEKRIRSIDSNGIVNTVAILSCNPKNLLVDRDGNIIYVCFTTNHNIFKYTVSNGNITALTSTNSSLVLSMSYNPIQHVVYYLTGSNGLCTLDIPSGYQRCDANLVQGYVTYFNGYLYSLHTITGDIKRWQAGQSYSTATSYITVPLDSVKVDKMFFNNNGELYLAGTSGIFKYTHSTFLMISSNNNVTNMIFRNDTIYYSDYTNNQVRVLTISGCAALPYVNSSTCEIICGGLEESDENVCSAHGSCIVQGSVTGCKCKKGYNGTNCELFSCFGVNNTDPTVCLSKGTCSDIDTCSCNESNLGKNCEHTCGGVGALDSSVCSSEGNCVKKDTCSCNYGRYGDVCQFSNACVNITCPSIANCTYVQNVEICVYSCNGIPSTNSKVCSGRGSCTDKCHCVDGWAGVNCEQKGCNGLLPSDPNVCSGNGTCLTDETGTYCSCKSAYSGKDCSDYWCEGILASNSSVCSQHGSCISVDKCKCNSGWTGSNCEVPTCDGIAATDPNVCNGGYCLSPNYCQPDYITKPYTGNYVYKIYSYFSTPPSDYVFFVQEINNKLYMGKQKQIIVLDLATGVYSSVLEFSEFASIQKFFVTKDERKIFYWNTVIPYRIGYFNMKTKEHIPQMLPAATTTINDFHFVEETQTVYYTKGAQVCMNSFNGSTLINEYCVYSQDTQKVSVHNNIVYVLDDYFTTLSATDLSVVGIRKPLTKLNSEYPQAVHITKNGVIFFLSDKYLYRYDISTTTDAPVIIAGASTNGYSGDGGYAVGAQFTGSGSCVTTLPDESILLVDPLALDKNYAATQVRILKPSSCSTNAFVTASNQFIGSSCLISCNGLLSNDTNVCSGNGFCKTGLSSSKFIDPKCVCLDGAFGSNCENFTCNGIESHNSTVCSGQGQCIAIDTCVCNSGYGGKHCAEYACNGIVASFPLVCNGIHKCTAPNYCEPNCNGVGASSNQVCSNEGICSSENNCTCNFGRIGNNCETSMACDNACVNGGVCLYSTGLKTCQCPTGYTGQHCELYICNGVASSNNSVCSGRGSCEGVDTCKCSNSSQWVGSNCEIPICFGIAANDPSVRGVCNDLGCVGPDTCDKLPYTYPIYPYRVSTYKKISNAFLDSLTFKVYSMEYNNGYLYLASTSFVFKVSITKQTIEKVLSLSDYGDNGTFFRRIIVSKNGRYLYALAYTPSAKVITYDLYYSKLLGVSALDYTPTQMVINEADDMIYMNGVSRIYGYTVNPVFDFNSKKDITTYSDYGIAVYGNILYKFGTSRIYSYDMKTGTTTNVVTVNTFGHATSRISRDGIVLGTESYVALWDRSSGFTTISDSAFASDAVFLEDSSVLSYGASRFYLFQSETCKSGYTMKDCIPSCGGILANDSSVCYGNGYCIATNKCKCTAGDSNYNCAPCTKKCNGGVCNFNGTITAPYCNCPSVLTGEFCEISKCSSDNDCLNPLIYSANNISCNGQSCIPAQCSSSADCQKLNVTGYNTCTLSGTCGFECLSNSDCSNNGNKTVCREFNSGFTYKQCAPECTTNAHCSNISRPICIQEKCSEVNCTTDSDCYSNNLSVCKSGICSYQCLSNQDCPRIDNYNTVCGSVSNVKTEYRKCVNTPFTCLGLNYTNPNVCSGNGNCTSSGSCSCNTGYSGPSCSIPTCFGIIGTNAAVCSGRGNCSKLDTCTCSKLYDGEMCQNVKQCSTVKCLNGGICNVTIDGEVCTCLSGYAGSKCEKKSCLSNLNCPASQPVCAQGVCNGLNCSTDATCKSFGFFKCGVDGQCRFECDSDSDCSNSNPVCRNNTCGPQCYQSKDCPAGNTKYVECGDDKYNNATYQKCIYKNCISNNDCNSPYTGTPKCDSSTFMCTNVSCSAHSDCYPYHYSMCDADGKCTVQCGNHTDCKQPGLERCGAEQNNTDEYRVCVNSCITGNTTLCKVCADDRLNCAVCYDGYVWDGTQCVKKCDSDDYCKALDPEKKKCNNNGICIYLACQYDFECTSYASLPKCTDGKCRVACLSDNDCIGSSPRCELDKTNYLYGHCVAECSEDGLSSYCQAKNPLKPSCNSDKCGYLKGCWTDESCATLSKNNKYLTACTADPTGEYWEKVCVPACYNNTDCEKRGSSQNTYGVYPTCENYKCKATLCSSDANCTMMGARTCRGSVELSYPNGPSFKYTDQTCLPQCFQNYECNQVAERPKCSQKMDATFRTCVPDCLTNNDCIESGLSSGKSECINQVCSVKTCASNSDCYVKGSTYCDPSITTCTFECVTNSDCKDSKKAICSQNDDMTYRRCVPECYNNTACAPEIKKNNNNFCSVELGKCVPLPCTSDNDCVNYGYGYCNPTSKVCDKECLDNTQCTDPKKPKCDYLAGRCKPDCLSDAECSSRDATPVCDLATQHCVAKPCSANSNCTRNGYGTCTNGACAPECTNDVQCIGKGTGICESANYLETYHTCTGTTASCSLAKDCFDGAAGYPVCEGGKCVRECLYDSDCTSKGSQFIGCNTNVGGICVTQACTSNSDCKVNGYQRCATRGNLGKQCLFTQCYDTSFCNTGSCSKNETTLNYCVNECLTTSDCKYGYTCQSNRCSKLLCDRLKPETSCSSIPYSKCIQLSGLAPYCTLDCYSNSDCKADEICNPIGWNCTKPTKPTTPTTNPCTLSCSHGKCDNTTGNANCICDSGYTGTLCEKEIPTTNPCNLDCTPSGTCINTTGIAICVCDEISGYSFQNGKCIRADAVCNGGCAHGICKYRDAISSATLCECDLGYKVSATGPCTSCNNVLGYVDSNGKCICDESAGLITTSNGTCVQTNAPKCQYDCGSNGECQFISATTSQCVCKNGFVTTLETKPCTTCPTGTVLKGAVCECNTAAGYIASGSNCVCDVMNGFNSSGSGCDCMTSLGFIKQGSSCVCKVGFKNVEGKCQAKVPVCANGCGKGVCKFIDITKSDDTQCICSSGYVTFNPNTPCSDCGVGYTKNVAGSCIRVCDSGFSGDDCSIYTPPTQCIAIPFGSLTYCKAAVYYTILNKAYTTSDKYNNSQQVTDEIRKNLIEIDTLASSRAQSIIDSIVNSGKTCDDTCRKAIANLVCYQPIKPCYSDKAVPYEKALCKGICQYIVTSAIVNTTTDANEICAQQPENDCFYAKYLPPSTSCYGKLFTDSAACSSRGICIEENSCSCRPGFAGLECQLSICFGYDSNSTKACSGNGDCVGVNTCKCKSGFAGTKCDIPVCNGKLESEGGCSFQGTCTTGGCSCNGNFVGSSCSLCKEGYTGSKCDIPICNGIKATDKGVCGGRGACVSNINGIPYCKCTEGYDGEVCQNFKCNGIDRNHRDVCSGVGTCVSIDTCVCKGNYESSLFCSKCTPAYSGSNCTERVCSDEVTCSGHGVCSNLKCSCNGNWVGDFCKICKEGFVGSDCQIQCTPAKNCSSRGTCNADGSCTCIGNSMGSNCEKCAEGWFGEKCDFRIDETTFGFSQNGDSISGLVYSSLKKKFTCSDLITNVNLLGEGASCLINSEINLMTISISPSATIKINDQLIFKKYFTSAETIQVVVKSKDFAPIAPTSTLTSSKASISKACGSIYLDASGSASKDRRALQFSWKVESSPSEDDTAVLQKILDEQQTLSGVKIVAKELSVGSYSVYVSVSSTFSQLTSTAYVTFEVSDLTAPTVTIKEGIQSSITIGKTSTISPQITFPSCYNGEGDISYVYSWDSKTINQVPIVQMKEILVFSSAHTNIVEPGEYYLTLTVSQKGAASATIPFTVSAKALPLVVGFNIRDMSQSFETDVSFIIEKRDPSNPTDSSGNIQLLCSNIDAGINCPGFKSNENNIDSSLTFKSSMLPGVYLFTAIYTKGSRSSSATVKVTVLDQPKSSVIRVSIAAPDGSDSSAIDPSTDLILQSTSADSLSTGRVLTWSSVELDLSSLTTSNKYINIPKSLLVPGATYSISVKIVDGVRSGDATYTFTINSPPTIGILEVDPKSGVALQDEFQIKCGNGWYDTQLPLTYKFMYKSSEATSWKSLSERSEKRSIATSLPAGTLDIKVIVYDSMGASSEQIVSGIKTTPPSSGDALLLLESAQKGSVSVSTLTAALSVALSVTPTNEAEKAQLQQAQSAFLNKFFEQAAEQSALVAESSESASNKVSIISSVSDNVQNFPDDTISKIISEFYATVTAVSSSSTVNMKTEDLENSKQSASTLENYVSSSLTTKRAIASFTAQDLNKIEQIKSNLVSVELKSAVADMPAVRSAGVGSNTYARLVSISTLGTLSEEIVQNGVSKFQMKDVFSSMKQLEGVETLKLVNKIYTVKNSTLRIVSKVIDFGIVLNNNVMSFNDNVTIANIKIEKVAQYRSLSESLACYSLQNQDYVIIPSCRLVSNDSSFFTIEINNSGSYMVAESSPIIPPQPQQSTSHDGNVITPKPNMNYLALLLLVIPVIALIAVIIGGVNLLVQKRKKGADSQLGDRELMSI